MAAALAILVTASRHTLQETVESYPMLRRESSEQAGVSSACGDTTSARTADLESSVQSAGVDITLASVCSLPLGQEPQFQV